jgi:hypothetical protein
MKIKNIGSIKNTLVRRMLTITVLPLTLLATFFVFLPVGAAIDAGIAATKYIYWAVQAVVWKLPINLFRVNREIIKIAKIALRRGWYGTKEEPNDDPEGSQGF